jgi:predicted ester cyclase
MTDPAAVYRAYIDAETRRDEAGMAAMMAPDIVIELNGQPALASADEDIAAMASLFEAYPDYRREIIEIIAAGDRAAARWVMVGQPRPELADRLPPLDIRGCSYVVVEDGRMTQAYVWSPAGVIEEILALLGSSGA